MGIVSVMEGRRKIHSSSFRLLFSSFFLFSQITLSHAEAQINTQQYGRRPYGVGLLVIGYDQTGPHLFECTPTGNNFEYYAQGIGSRSQSARTYLERHFEEFADGECEIERLFWGGEDKEKKGKLMMDTSSPLPPPLYLCPTDPSPSSCHPQLASLEKLILHGLRALRDTLQQDKKLTQENLSIAFVGKDEEFTVKDGEDVVEWLTFLEQEGGGVGRTEEEPANDSATATQASGATDASTTGGEDQMETDD